MLHELSKLKIKSFYEFYELIDGRSNGNFIYDEILSVVPRNIAVQTVIIRSSSLNDVTFL